MELDNQQIAELKKLVYDMVDYRESYEELYDHILTGLNTVDQNIVLLDAVDNIIDDDFGGYPALFKMEDERQRIVSRQIKKQQRRNFIGYLTPPMVVFTIAIGWFFYFATNRFLDPRSIELAFFVTAFVPSLVVWIGKGMLEFKDQDDPKKSIRDGQINRFAILSLSIIQIFLGSSRWLLKIADGQDTLDQFHSAIIAVLFTVYVIYVLSFFKLYRQEFKMQLT